MILQSSTYISAPANTSFF